MAELTWSLELFVPSVTSFTRVEPDGRHSGSLFPPPIRWWSFSGHFLSWTFNSRLQLSMSAPAQPQTHAGDLANTSTKLGVSQWEKGPQDLACFLATVLVSAS